MNRMIFVVGDQGEPSFEIWDVHDAIMLMIWMDVGLRIETGET